MNPYCTVASSSNNDFLDWSDTQATYTVEGDTGWITGASADEYWFNEIWQSIVTEIVDTYEERLEKIQKWRTKMQGMFNRKSSKHNPKKHYTNIWNG